MTLSRWTAPISLLYQKIIRPCTLLLVVTLLGSSCIPSPAPPPLDSQPSPSRTSTAPPTLAPTATRLPSLTPSPTAKKIWLDPHLPSLVVEKLQLPSDWINVKSREGADLLLSAGRGEMIGHWTYALAAPFPSLREEFSLDELQSLWSGKQPVPEHPAALVLSPSTKQFFTLLWGEANPSTVQVFPAADLLESAWGKPGTLALLPFQELQPRWKVLSLAGQMVTQADYSQEDYPLAVPLTMKGAPEEIHRFQTLNPQLSNRDPQALTTVAVTGVTALVRATAYTMEEQGIHYPAQDLLPIFSAADLTHVSNEVPFAEDCPPPDPGQTALYFCSRDSYAELLDLIGTDVVELTGDHFGDWGTEAMFHTLDLYEEYGWITYGGGKNLSAGLEPALLEHHGNRLAFIGCNAKGGKYATAAENKPGSSLCDFPALEDEIQRLAGQGILVVATMQHDEFYQFQANYLQKRDFRRLAEAGAVIVSGSQAHQPQMMEFWDHSFIHYGLGNLFFDQYRVARYVERYQHTNKAFIDLHTFYQGRHLSTDLRTIKFVDFARSRPMSAEEHETLLRQVFQAAGWELPPTKDKP